MGKGIMEPLHFIVNPLAKEGNCGSLWKRLEVALERSGRPYKAYMTEYPGHAAELSEKIGRETFPAPVCLAAVGGDGTIHEVANGAAGFSNIILWYIPGGSGNDFSRGYSVPARPERALDLLLESVDGISGKLVDAGMVEVDGKKVYFVNNMGAGFDAHVARQANRSPVKALFNRLGLGRLVYVFFFLKELINYKAADMELTVDGVGTPYQNVWFITVSNQPFYGGGMKIAPAASVSDGLLDVTVVHNLSKWKLLLVFITVFWGGHMKFKEVASHKGKKITINTARPIVVHADGEHIGSTPLGIQVQEQALSIYSGQKVVS